ncbi:MAG TPA: hypothetical protein DDY32_03920, partial [Desulfobulbaceae bacterium]|nr:hypothetical protein [Desulfobulbaceae bacterium]
KLSAELPAQLQGTVDLGLSGRYDMEAERLTLTTLDLAKPELLTLAAEADFDLAANRLAARLQARIDPAASSLTGNAARWQGLDLQGEAQGNLAMPDLHLKVTGQSVTTPVLTTRELSLTVRTTAREDRLAVEVQGTAQGNDWTEAGLAAILGERLDLALKADVAGDFHDMTMEDVVIAAAGLQLTGRAGLDDNGAVTAAAVTADIADLAVFSALTGMELSGAGRLTVQNGAWDPAGSGRAEFEITAKELGLGQADLDRLAGPQPALAGHLELSPRQDLTVKLDRIDLAMTDGSLSLALTDGFARMAAAGELAVLPGALPPDIGVVMPQAARLAVQLDGPVDAPAGEIDLAVPTIESGGERFDKIEITSTLEWSEEAVLSLLNRADFTLRGRPYQLSADVVLPPDRLQLAGLKLKGDMLELAGGLELPGYEPPMRGIINLTRLDAAMLRDWAPPVAAGQVTGKIDFLPEEKKQRIAIDATARGLRLAGGSGADQNGLDHLTLSGHVADAFGEPAVELQLTGAKIAYGQATLDKLQAALHGPLSGLRATLSTAGQFQPRQTHESLPVTLSAAADMTLAEDIQVKVSRLTAGIGTEKIALRRPLQLNRTAAGAVDGTAALAIGEGGLDGTFSFIPDKEISATAKLSGIALGPWDKITRQGLTGILSLSANWNEQVGKAARAGLSASVGEIRLAQIDRITEGGQTPSLALQLDANLNQGRLDGSLSAGGPELQ